MLSLAFAAADSIVAAAMLSILLVAYSPMPRGAAGSWRRSLRYRAAKLWNPWAVLGAVLVVEVRLQPSAHKNRLSVPAQQQPSHGGRSACLACLPACPPACLCPHEASATTPAAALKTCVQRLPALFAHHLPKDRRLSPQPFPPFSSCRGAPGCRLCTDRLAACCLGQAERTSGLFLPACWAPAAAQQGLACYCADAQRAGCWIATMWTRSGKAAASLKQRGPH